MEKIRILRIISRMNVGGPAVQITNLMNHLDSDTFQQKLITGYCENNEVDFLDQIQPNFDYFRIKGFGRSLNIIYDIIVFIQLIKEIKKFDPHIVHTHTAKAGALGRIAALLSKPSAKRVHTFHGHLLTGYFKGAKLNLLINAEKIFAKISHKLVAVGSNVRSDLLRAGIGSEKKFAVINPGIEIERKSSDRFDSLDDGKNSSQTTVTYLGRLTKIKRIDRLIEVIKIIHSKNLSVRFLIAGGGEEVVLLQKATEEHNLPVKILGWVTHITSLLSVSDVLILTSDNEGTPISIIQAGLMGVPVVATNVGSVEELVLDGKTGFICDKTSASLADKIMIMAENSELRKEMGAAAKMFMENSFSLSTFLENHKNMYVDVLNN